MSNTSEDTIAAIATPHGRGGVAIIRISGSQALTAAKILTGTDPKPRHAYFKTFILNNEVLDEGVLLYFNAPHSYTGEDVVELQGHAGNIVPQRLLQAVLSIEGIRQAEPGEFTRRAYMNNKMDLTAAEAVEDLISAGSESAARAALASLEGAFFHDMQKLNEDITSFRVRIEACLDFPEEHEDFFDTGKAASDLEQIRHHATLSLSKASQGVKLTEGARIVLAGAPNAGKSSLLNALAGMDKAIVTNIPGTTRDVLSAEIEIDGVPITLTDTAGIRDEPADEIERIGIERALEELKKADLILLLVDGSQPPKNLEETFEHIGKFKGTLGHVIVIVTKADLPDHAETRALLESKEFSSYQKIRTSTKNPDGLTALRAQLANALGIMPIVGVYSARSRHLTALKHTLHALDEAANRLAEQDLVLCAQEMWEALDHLGSITGKTTSDDIIGKIFSTFCIGK